VRESGDDYEPLHPAYPLDNYPALVDSTPEFFLAVERSGGDIGNRGYVGL